MSDNKIEKIELKPCPFCGGEARLLHDCQLTGVGFRAIECTGCNAITPIRRFDKEVVDIWNTRAETQLQKAKERIEKLEAEDIIARKCNSCMSRQIDKLTNEPLSCNPVGDECDQDWRDNKRIDDLVAQLKQHEWISVDDRLPEADVFGVYFVMPMSKMPQVARSYNHKMKTWFDKHGERMQIITHWKSIAMPISKKEGE